MGKARDWALQQLELLEQERVELQQVVDRVARGEMTEEEGKRIMKQALDSVMERLKELPSTVEALKSLDDPGAAKA